MNDKVNLKSIYCPSSDIVTREIEGELIIVPLVAGIGDMEDDLFTFNETGKAIWKLLDGHHSLKEIVDQLLREYKVSENEIIRDVSGLINELLKRGMLVEKKS